MAKDFSAMEDSNRSSNPSIHAVSDPARRVVLRGGAATALVALLAPMAGCAVSAGTAAASGPRLGFTGIPPGAGDTLVVPEGYVARAIAAWGEPIGIAGNMPAFRFDASNSAAEQAVQMGMHHDGVAFFPLAGSSSHGLIAVNHDYTDDGLLHVDGFSAMNAEKVRKSQNAHGLSVYEVRRQGDDWEMVRPSRYARRFTMDTPFTLQGPAAGHPMMRTAADPAGRTVRGTLNNCASSQTPWGTYLSGEENWMGYFGHGDAIDAHQRRWGARKEGAYRWDRFDARFDAAKNPNEPNRFGWVVEVDPMDPSSTPVKRTALGRAAHEGAWVAVTRDGRAVVYSGEDARFEYIYRFVSRDRIAPGGARANRELLDHGVLSVARFDADGRGQWIPLVHGQGPLTAANGFADQGEVLVKCRQAADRVAATMMDRPEWIAVHPSTREVYLTLTNNSRRGNTPASSNPMDGTSSAGSANPPVDAANPRPDNDFGHIVRWRDDLGNVAATGFAWDIFVKCGDKATTKTLDGSYTPDGHDGYAGNINGDDYGAPDGLWFDREGRLWIQTDQQGDANGDWVNIGGNVMMCADPSTGQTRRFLTSPPGCEVTGVTGTPDGKTLFVGIQHPGEDWRVNPTEQSTWPDSGLNGPTTASDLGTVHKPRSGVVAITRDDGGVIGT